MDLLFRLATRSHPNWVLKIQKNLPRKFVSGGEQPEERRVPSIITRKAIRQRDLTSLHIHTQRSAADALRLGFFLCVSPFFGGGFRRLTHVVRVYCSVALAGNRNWEGDRPGSRRHSFPPHPGDTELQYLFPSSVWVLFFCVDVKTP